METKPITMRSQRNSWSKKIVVNVLRRKGHVLRQPNQDSLLSIWTKDWWVEIKQVSSVGYSKPRWLYEELSNSFDGPICISTMLEHARQ